MSVPISDDEITSDITPTGAAGSYEVPEGTDMMTLARALFPPEPETAAVLRVREGRGQSLRRNADSGEVNL